MENKQLIKRVDLCKIRLKDGHVFYIPLDKMEAFIQLVEKSSMVKLEGTYYNKWHIDEVGPETIDERVLKLSPAQRKTLEFSAKYYLNGLGRYPNDHVLSKWVEKLLSGQQITFNF